MKPADIPVQLLEPRPAAALGEAHVRTLMDQAQTGQYVVRGGSICHANPALASMLGWTGESLVGQAHGVTMVPEDHARAAAAIERCLAGHPGRPDELRCVRRDGSQFDMRSLARWIDFEGQPAVLVTLLDTSDLSEALRLAEWNASMLARTEAMCRAGSFETELPSGRLRMSAGLLCLLALPPDTPLDATLEALAWVPPEEQAYVAGIWRGAVVGEPFEFQHRVLCADGRRLVVLHRGQLGADGNGVALLQDISAQVEAARRIQDLATHHEVTGLPNRAWLLDQVDAAIHAARWESRGFALLAIDVPRIAEIKSNMGFGAGDTLCMALAARLRNEGSPDEVLAQLADTEFAVMVELPAGSDKQTLRAHATALQQSLQVPVRLGATDVYAQCLVGIAAFPDDGDTADHLLERAQTARLDLTAGQGVAFFRPELTTRALRSMNIESALWQALEREEFVLHYQPQVDMASGNICGAEGLLRWFSPELGTVSPGEFIPVAERSGLIGAIGDWVLQQACRQLAAWRSAGLPPVRVAVNLAASQLQRPDLAEHVQALLLQTGADPDCLGIDLTESMVMTDIEGAAATLRAIKTIGVQISLDDFGTGFSSLSCLSRLPIDVVKVDRSFVHDVTAGTQDASVTRAIIHMTHGLQMRVLAEGVETESQLGLLVAAGCDEFQGYWFSPALPAADFEAMLRSGKRLPERYLRNAGGHRQRTLLLVDDEENILSALKRLLRRDGYRIVTANSGAQGLLRLAEQEVDVIVSDQRMPGMTGVEFLHRAKALYPDTLRLVLSGYTELQSIIDAINEGAIYKFLTKPWDDERLRGHVAEAFRQKEMADENRRLAQQVASANADLASLNERLERLLSQQRGQAELLAASAGSMRDVLDELPIGVLGLDADGALAFVNREAERLLPQFSSLLGEQAAALLPADLLAPMSGSAPLRCRVLLESRCFDVLVRPLPGGKTPGGRLLMLLPAQAPSGPAGPDTKSPSWACT